MTYFSSNVILSIKKLKLKIGIYNKNSWKKCIKKVKNCILIFSLVWHICHTIC